MSCRVAVLPTTHPSHHNPITHTQLWDLRHGDCVSTFTERYQVLSVAMADQGDQIYTAGIENEIKVWDLRKEELSMTLTVRVCEYGGGDMELL